MFPPRKRYFYYFFSIKSIRFPTTYEGQMRVIAEADRRQLGLVLPKTLNKKQKNRKKNTPIICVCAIFVVTLQSQTVRAYYKTKFYMQ